MLHDGLAGDIANHLCRREVAGVALKLHRLQLGGMRSEERQWQEWVAYYN